MIILKRTYLILAFLVALLAINAETNFDSEFLWKDVNALAGGAIERITPTNPPTGNVRAIAEFEPMTAVIVRYPLGIPTQFVALLSEESPVICIVEDSYTESQAQSAFDAANVNNDNLSFIHADSDSYWTRDFSSWFIVDGNNEVGVLDFEYNRPRPNDNLFPSAFAAEYDYNYFAMNIEQTGGNFMTDGYGIAASSHIAYTENGNNETLVNSTMQNFMGIDNYMVIQDPNETYIDHVDCWGKFLAVDKVLIRDVAPSHSQYDELNDVADNFATTNCSWGYPYEVIRVYAPQDQPYSNSLILNDRVFVPQTGSQWDDEAMAVYEEAMPGYRIFGVTNTTYNPWESTDALHCRTHEIADKEMLSILHYPIFGEVTDETITIEATIVALSTEAIYADSTVVYYSTSTTPEWQEALMTAGDDNLYSADIGPFAAGDIVKYYIHSADASGQSEDYPYVGISDPFTFLIAGTTPDVAPVISDYTQVTTIETANLPIDISCTVTDINNDISEVTLMYTVNAHNGELVFLATTDNNYVVQWDFSTFLYEDTGNAVSYMIVATDDAGLSSETPTINVNVNITPNANNDIESFHGILSTYPNPFKDSVNLKIRAKSSKQELLVYNVKGQLVRTIKSNAKSNRKSTVSWNGKDKAGQKVATGVYYIIMNDNGSKSTKKVLLMK